MRRSSHIAVPLRRPDDVIPHLGRPIHWKQGRSAKAVADSWFRARDIPSSVRAVLSRSHFLADAELLDGWLERETDLGDRRGSPSQTDLLALLGIGKELGVLGIEAKVDESFGPLVSEWLGDGGVGKTNRLAGLCELLGLDSSRVGHLRYQLLHRTAAVIFEARRFRSDIGVLIVQSFCPRTTGLADCAAFFEAIGMPGLEAGGLVGPWKRSGVTLWAGWASDDIPAAVAAVDIAMEAIPS